MSEVYSLYAIIDTRAGGGTQHGLSILVIDTWEKQVLSARGFKRVGRKTLRIHHINGMEVRKKRPRGLK